METPWLPRQIDRSSPTDHPRLGCRRSVVHPVDEAAWWLSPTPLKNDGVKVSWDDEIPNIWKNKKCSKPQTIYIYICV
jgi:hypothetical protein